MDLSKTKSFAEQVNGIVPDDVNADDVAYRQYVLAKIQKAEDDIRAGRVHTTEEARALVAKWLQH